MSRIAILESALDCGLGRKYGHTGNDAVDCVIFTEAVLQLAFPWIDFGPKHRDLMIQDGKRPFSNIEALVSLGFREVSEPEPGAFNYCQGWRSLDPLSGGHCFLFWNPKTPFDEPSKILEATNATSDWYRPLLWSDRQARFQAGLRLVSLKKQDR